MATFAAAGCLVLAWWQWTRFQSASGTFQNLGYALQWPMFAGFCFYAYYKFVRYEDAPPEPHKHDTITEIPPGLYSPKDHRLQRLPTTTPLYASTTLISPSLQTETRNTRRHDGSPDTNHARRSRP